MGSVSTPSTETTDTSSLPTDAKLLTLLLSAYPVDHEPSVLPFLLDFMHKYTVDQLQTARQFAHHAQRTTIEASDVHLASRAGPPAQVGPPSRALLAQVAAKRNVMALPVCNKRFGVRLPDKHALLAQSFQITVQKKVPVDGGQNLNSFRQVVEAASTSMMEQEEDLQEEIMIMESSVEQQRVELDESVQLNQPIFTTSSSAPLSASLAQREEEEEEDYDMDE